MRDGGAAGVEEGAAYYEAFRALAASSEFAREEFARRPKLIEHVPGVAGSFTLDHLAVAVDSDFLDAGRGITDRMMRCCRRFLRAGYDLRRRGLGEGSGLIKSQS